MGGYAPAVHGRVRATRDVDVFVGTEAHNAAKVWRALVSVGARLHELRVEDLIQAETLFIMGRPPNQIDIITTIDGIDFRTAWQNRYESTYGGLCVTISAATTSSLTNRLPIDHRIGST